MALNHWQHFSRKKALYLPDTAHKIYFPATK